MNLDNTSEFARDDSPITGQHDAPSGGISFATGTSVLGTVLVARSAHGVCAILIGSQADELIADLAARFPENTLARNDQRLGGDLEKIRHFIENPRRASISTSTFTARRSSGGCGMRCARFPPAAP